MASSVSPPPVTASPATAGPSTDAASSAPSSLPGYYTAYWAQYQQHQPQHQAGPPTGYYPPGHSYPYPYYPYQTPPSTHPTPSPDSTAPTQPATPASASTSATSASTADAAALAAYHEQYAAWYQQYQQYYASQAAQQHAHPYPHAHTAAQPNNAAPPSAATSSHPAPPDLNVSAHSAPATTSHLPNHYAYPPAQSYNPYSYPHAQHSAPHPPPSTATPPSYAPPSHSSPYHTLTNHSHPPAATNKSQHLPPAPSSSPPSTSSTRRSRWASPDTAEPSRPPASQPASSSPTPDPSSIAAAWPPDVIEYVKRSLHYCPAHAKEEVERYMRDRLQTVVNSGEIHRIDWKVEPLAHTKMLAEQLKAKYDKGAATAAVQDERKRIEEERKEWDSRRVREEEERLSQQREKRRDRKRGRDHDEKHKDPSSSSSSDEDIADFLSSNTLTARQRRKERRSQARAGKSAIWTVDVHDHSRNRDRASRFSAYIQEAAAAPLKQRIRTDLFTASGAGDDEGIDWSALQIVGTSTSLEKSYFRLTSAPDPSSVRPPPILHQALDRLLTHWADHHEYPYLCDQMKAIRQDLTVQHHHTPFTIRVYEAHARIAIEVGDMSEYNQCQTQLRQLYLTTPDGREHEVEFTMYRLCYCIITSNQSAINSMLREVSHIRSLPPIAHVLTLRSALATSDFYTFLNRYRQTPFKGRELLRVMVGRVRVRALEVLVKGYKPTKVEVGMAVRVLGFEDKGECQMFVKSCGAVLSDDGETLITANSEIHEPDIEEEEVKEDKHGITHALFAHMNTGRG